MKEFVTDIHPQHYRSPRSRIICDLADCGCKSSTMIWISHPLKAIWFETPKAASAAIKQVLHINPTPNKRSRTLIERISRSLKGADHHPDFQFEMWQGDEYQVIKQYPSYYKFAIVRNPWDRMVSNWSMFCRAGLPDRERKIEVLFGKKSSEIEFSEFVTRSVSIHNHHWQQYVDFLPWDGNILLLNKLGKLESLADDWCEIARGLGIDLELHARNQTDHRHYRSYYDKTLRDIVASSFKDDIRAFKYEF